MAGRLHNKTRTYSNTPACVIYAQSWPVPGSKPNERRPQSNSARKSLAPSWVEEERRKATWQSTTETGVDKKPHSWTTSMLNSHYPDWIEDETHVKLDMAKEFNLTLKMFKKYTQQVQEIAGENINSTRNPYSFKHYFNNQDYPGLYRSQLHLSVNQRSYTPPPWNREKEKVEQPRAQSQLAYNTKAYKYSKMGMESKMNGDGFQKVSKALPNEQNKLFARRQLDDDGLLQNFHMSESHLDLPSDEKQGEGFDLYIDPVPNNWSELKLEELEEVCEIDGKDEQDPFLLRYFRLRRLEAETIENEKSDYQRFEENPKSLINNVDSSSRMNVGVKQLKKMSSNSNCSKSKDEQALRNLERNFQKCAIFKSDVDQGKPKSSIFGQTTNSVRTIKERPSSSSVASKKGKCLSARAKRDSPTTSLNTAIQSRSSNYSNKVEHYDIIELATTFEPPSKERINVKPRPVTAKSAKSKGLLPGKSWDSQRRCSLTNDQAIPQHSTSDSLLTKTKSSKSRLKSAKRKTKRCASSKF